MCAGLRRYARERDSRLGRALKMGLQEPQMLVSRSRDLRKQVRSVAVMMVVCKIDRVADVPREGGITVNQRDQMILLVDCLRVFRQG